jgi:glycosyltransferase involved in cell wall biosynthesis
VLTSNVSSLPEVAGEAALLVAPDDVQAIAEAMGRLLRDESLRHTLGARGMEQARRFSWEQTARHTLAAYRTVVGPGPYPGPAGHEG